MMSSVYSHAMNEEKHQPPAASSPHARFPWVQAAFCAACVGTAAWLWMRDSHAWRISPDALAPTPLSASGSRTWNGELVRVEGTVMTHIERTPIGEGGASARAILWVGDPAPDCSFPDSPRVRGRAVCVLTYSNEHAQPGVRSAWVGRVAALPSSYGLAIVDTAAGRFTGASVAGLVVGAMGVFIFALHLNRWLAHRPEAPAVPLSQPVASGALPGDHAG